MRPFWDFAWQAPAPDLFVQYGVDAASYTGSARQPVEYYAALAARKIEVLGIQETDPNRAQQGYNAGRMDVDFARRRWAEVGFSRTLAPIAYAVSDGSRWDPNYGGDQIAQYGEAVGDYETGPYKFYGNRYAVDHACLGAQNSLHPDLCLNLSGGWIPRTWDFDPYRDTAAQEIGGTPVAGIDVNTVYQPIFGPAPAPPGPAPDLPEGTIAMLVLITADGFWVKSKEFWVFGPGQAAQHVGQGQSLGQVLADWGHLPTLSLPPALPDSWVTQSIQATVVDPKRLKAVADKLQITA